MLKRKQFSRTSKTRLNLIKNQQRTNFLATLFQIDEISLFRHDKTCGSLNSFHNYTGRFFRDSTKVIFIIELNEIDHWQQRTEFSLMKFIAGNRKCAVCVPVISFFESDDFFSSCVTFCQF